MPSETLVVAAVAGGGGASAAFDWRTRRVPNWLTFGITAVGVGLAALLFAALETGTASRNLDPEIFPPDLASSLAIIIQGLVVPFVGAQFVILLLLRRARTRAAGAAST